MKQLFALLLSVLLLACDASAPVPTPETPLPVVKTAVEIEPEPLASFDAVTEPSSPAPTEAPTAAPSAAPAPRDTASLTEPIRAPRPSEPLPVFTSLRTFDWDSVKDDGDFPMTYRSATLDFQDLGLTLIGLDADEAGTTLTLRVQHPASWSLTESQCMNAWFLRYAVRLDGEEISFPVRDMSVRYGRTTKDDRCDDYTVTLFAPIDAHTLAAHQSLRIVPFVQAYDSFAQTRYTKTDGDAVICTTLKGHPHSGRIVRTHLDALAIDVDLAPLCAGVAPAELPEKKPLLYPVTLENEDIDRMVAEGIYDKDGEFPWYGTRRNEVLDVSDLTFTLETFEVGDAWIWALLHLHFPDSWTAEQKYRLHLYSELLIDGKPAMHTLGAPRNLYPRGGAYPKGFGLAYSNAEVERYEKTDVYYEIFASREFLPVLQRHDELKIILFVPHIKTLRIEGRRWNLDEGETPYGDIFKMDILDRETLTIEEKTVTIRLRDVLPKEGEA